MEIHYGEFRTDVELPGAFEREGMEAEYNDGYLKIVLPKSKPRRIDVA
jgi:HSP20 family molecular chaperone IbpA